MDNGNIVLSQDYYVFSGCHEIITNSALFIVFAMHFAIGKCHSEHATLMGTYMYIVYVHKMNFIFSMLSDKFARIWNHSVGNWRN